LCLGVLDGVNNLLPEVARFVIEKLSGISERVACFSEGDENGAQNAARQRRFVRVFVTPHTGERLLHRASDHGRVGVGKGGERIKTDDKLTDIWRDNMHALGCEPLVILQKAQHHVEQAVRVAAVRIKHADAAAAGDILEDAVEKERALAAPGGTDEVHMLKAGAVFDAQELPRVVDAKGDEIVWTSSAGLLWSL